MPSVFRSLLICLCIPLVSLAQPATVRETSQSLTTYPFSDPDPVPRPGRIYPYFRFDGYTDKGRSQSWQFVELENPYVKVSITPQIGGKVWGAVEKQTNFPFVYFNHAVKFRDVAMRGAWTSGGIEFNFGDIGHAPTTSTPVDYITRTNPDGSVSCFVGATDWASRTTWRVEIRLPKDKAAFETRSFWYNQSPIEQSYYHWMNAGFRSAGNLEFVFPGTNYIGHAGESATWPVDAKGRKLNFYEQNNFGSYKSYHVLGELTNFYGGYWHQDAVGFVHHSPFVDKPGKKVWVWGLSRQGMIWEKLLTDSDGQYVELQSGRQFNQAAAGSTESPFKHVGFTPYGADSWTETWYPVRNTRGLTHASDRNALNFRVENGWLKLDVMPLQATTDSLVVIQNGKPVLAQKLNLLPLQTFRDSLRWEGTADGLGVRVGDDWLVEEKSTALSRPLTAPAKFNWESEYGLFLRGKDLLYQRQYAEAETYLSRALQKNANLLPALTTLAQIRYRQGLFAEARDFTYRALSVNTYDPEANYLWGLTNEQTGEIADARDGFSIAAQHPGWRSGALLRLAFLEVRRQQWGTALKLVEQSREAQPTNRLANQLAALLSRKAGRTDEALKLQEALLEADPLDHFARLERFFLTGKQTDKTLFKEAIRSELPHETYLELAIQYAGWNQLKEAVSVLELAPTQPMVQLWQAYLYYKQGKTTESDAVLKRALASSAAFCLPFRVEDEPMLMWALARQPHWKIRYYKGLLHWQQNRLADAKKLFAECSNEPDWAPFYLAKADLFANDTETALESLIKASLLDPSNWRVGFRLASFYAAHGEPAKALKVASTNRRANTGNYVVGLQYARMLRLNNRYRDALSILNGLKMLPAEGATDAHGLFRETNILLALELMKTRKWKESLRHLQQAETWPENLGSGEPYTPDNRLTQLLQAYCYQQVGDKAGSERANTYLRAYQNPEATEPHPADRLSEWAAQQSTDFKSVVERLLTESKTGNESAWLRSFLTIL